MHRAQRTLELLNLGFSDPYPWQSPSSDPSNSHSSPSRHTTAKVTITPLIREWDYGDYEGITSADIRSLRSKSGAGPWDIWTDGCPGGESPSDVMARMDALIDEIRMKHHAPYIGKEKGEGGCSGDVLVVAHGHILRAFAMRWVGKSLEDTKLLMEAGGVGTLSYEHHSIEEPAIVLGGGFVVGGEVLQEVDEEEREGKIK